MQIDAGFLKIETIKKWPHFLLATLYICQLLVYLMNMSKLMKRNISFHAVNLIQPTSIALKRVYD